MARTLLLADDSVTIQRVIELTFADEDIRVVAVSDGDQAIARLDSEPPDIVLADVGMPGRSGYEVAEYIKGSPALTHIPVLLLTGAFEPIDEERAHAAGCDGVLAKPFEPQLVIGRVRELLDQSAPRGVEPGEAAEPAEAAAEPAQEDDWTLSTAPPEDAAPAAAEEAGGTVDDYFDRLDAAFATLGERDRPGFGVPPPVPAQPAYAPPAFEPPPADAPPAWPRAEAPVAVAAPPEPLPALADAFAAILAAERAAAQGVEPAAWPVAPAEPVVGEEVIEAVAERVMARLSDRVVRETVSEMVSRVAERLVREEIERIRAARK